jgi:hypothetical protein
MMRDTSILIGTLTENLNQVRSSLQISHEEHIGMGSDFETYTHSVGNINGKKIFLAKKIPTYNYFSIDEILCRHLWFMDRYIDTSSMNFEDSFSSLPQVYGVVKDINNNDYILTEDFSMANENELEQITSRDSLVSNGKIQMWRGALMTVQAKNPFDDFEVTRPFFSINGEIRVGDFGTFANLNGVKETYGKYVKQLTLDLTR